MINIIQKIIKLRRSIYRTEIISLRASNKIKLYFKIRFLRSLTCLNLDRTVISPILIGWLSSEHSKTSFGHDSFPQLIGISIDSECSMFDGFRGARNSNRTRKKIYIYNFDHSSHPSLAFFCLLGCAHVLEMEVIFK